MRVQLLFNSIYISLPAVSAAGQSEVSLILIGFYKSNKKNSILLHYK